MNRPLVAVVDYGIGNLHSAQKALSRLGADARLTADPASSPTPSPSCSRASVPSGPACDALRSRELEAPVLDAVGSGRPFLGICVGMQMLFEASEEAPGARGLGVLPGVVRWLPPGVKRPQMQWNRVDVLDRRSDVRRARGAAVVLLRALAPRRAGGSVARRRHVRLRRPGQRRVPGRQRLRHAVPPGEVSGRRARPARQLRDRAGGGRLTTLYPSIDLRDGKVVRLAQGDYAQETVYGDDPVAVAESFCAQGAPWMHVVDLDAARTGEPVNRDVVAAIVGAVGGRAQVQAGGGVRTVDAAAALADVGVARVVMGSAAVADPDLVDRVAGIVPVAVGLDHRDGRLAVHGWTETDGRGARRRAAPLPIGRRVRHHRHQPRRAARRSGPRRVGRRPSPRRTCR